MPLHVLRGGTPCQSFSSAGTQLGLRDPRRALSLKYLELVHGIRAKAPFQGLGVPVSIWENVGRFLHLDGGHAFGTVLAGLLGCDGPLRPAELYGPRWPDTGLVSGPQRIVAWAVLDAVDFGLPQRRRRLFVVSVRHGNELCPRETLAGARARAARADGRGPDGAPTGSPAAIRASCGIRVRLWQRRRPRDGRGAPVDIARTLISQAGTSRRGDTARLWLVERPDGTAYTRRMMPVEYKRLQGMPEGHTRISYAGCDAEDCPDAPRYKAVGNSVTVPVVRSIAAGENALVRAHADVPKGPARPAALVAPTQPQRRPAHPVLCDLDRAVAGIVSLGSRCESATGHGADRRDNRLTEKILMAWPLRRRSWRPISLRRVQLTSALVTGDLPFVACSNRRLRGRGFPPSWEGAFTPYLIERRTSEARLLDRRGRQ